MKAPVLLGPPTARGLALQVLLDCRTHDAFVQEALDKHLRRANLRAADRGLAPRWVIAVLRPRGLLVILLRPLGRRPGAAVVPWGGETAGRVACRSRCS